MGNTTTLERLGKIPPNSETHWRSIAAAAHRTWGYPGDEAAARTHENEIYSIRHCEVNGTSRMARHCPRCLERGIQVLLLFMGGMDRCGNCLWPGQREDVHIPGL